MAKQSIDFNLYILDPKFLIPITFICKLQKLCINYFHQVYNVVQAA